MKTYASLQLSLTLCIVLVHETIALSDHSAHIISTPSHWLSMNVIAQQIAISRCPIFLSYVLRLSDCMTLRVACCE